MKLGLRLFFGFFLITGLAAFFVMRVFVAEVQPSVREVMEDLMVDTANILADDLSALPEGGDLRESPFARRLEAYRQRPVTAQIWGLTKQSLDYRVYITDARGRVVFDTPILLPDEQFIAMEWILGRSKRGQGPRLRMPKQPAPRPWGDLQP